MFVVLLVVIDFFTAMSMFSQGVIEYKEIYLTCGEPGGC